jgi:multidrug resistance efflux pump
VVAPIQATLSVRFPSRIRAVFAREGETVHAGQPILDLDESDLATQENSARAAEAAARAQVDRALAGLKAQQVKSGADLDAAQGALRQAETRLQQALLARQAAADEQKADLRTAEAAVRKAQIAADRAQETVRSLEELARVGGVSRSDLEAARAQQRVSQADLETANGQVERLQAGQGGVPFRVASAEKDADAARSAEALARGGVRAAQQGGRQAIQVAEQDVRAARATLHQAAAATAGARAARAQAHLTSPVGGLLTNIGARAGEVAQPGAPLATVVSVTGLRVDALVPARLLALFHGGQSADVSVDTAPGRVFNAVVSEIARVAEPDGRTFRVKFRLLGTPPLLPGQTAHIRVQTSH